MALANERITRLAIVRPQVHYDVALDRFKAHLEQALVYPNATDPRINSAYNRLIKDIQRTTNYNFPELLPEADLNLIGQALKAMAFYCFGSPLPTTDDEYDRYGNRDKFLSPRQSNLIVYGYGLDRFSLGIARENSHLQRLEGGSINEIKKLKQKALHTIVHGGHNRDCFETGIEAANRFGQID